MDMDPEKIRLILIGLFILIVSVAIHEFGHAWMADHLGDDTPRRQGRVTLNPIAHIDPIGTILLPVLGGYFGAGFGWGRPVQWQPHKVRRSISMSTANILVSFAGPFMNLVLALVVSIVTTVLVSQHVIGYGSQPHAILYMAAFTNFLLFFFNLMPVPPLDGGHIAQAFVPYRHRDTYAQIAKYAPFALLAIVMIPQLAQVFIVPAKWCTEHLYRALFALFGM